MIVWQGLGFLAVLIPALLLVLLGMIEKTMPVPHGNEIVTLLSAIAVWFIGKYLNSMPGKVLIDPETNQKVELKEKHTIFWVPMQWFSIILLAITVNLFFS